MRSIFPRFNHSQKENEKGQALFEFLIFVPFMMSTYMMVGAMGDAINGSINQQKVSRGYFYSLVLGDSLIPRKDMQIMADGSVKRVGMWYVGWRTKFEGGNNGSGKPIAPCYKLATLVAPTDPDECLDDISGNTTTQYVRVKTAYGVCSTTYINDEMVGSHVSYPGAVVSTQGGDSAAGCTLGN